MKRLLPALFALLAGCQAPRLELLHPLDDAEVEHAVRSVLAELYPASMRATHRAMLTVRGRQIVLDGYLLTEQPDKIRIVASTGMGGTVFDVFRRGESTHILRNPMTLRPVWLQAALRDAACIYQWMPSERAVLGRHEDGTLAFREQLKDGTVAELHIDCQSVMPVRYQRTRGHRVLYSIQFLAENVFDRWDRPVPSTIQVHDRVLNYQMKLTVTDVRPVKMPVRAFEE